MIYIECNPSSKKQLAEQYPNATFVPNEGYLWVLAPGIKEALHNIYAPQSGTNWRVISNGYYHSVVEVL